MSESPGARSDPAKRIVSVMGVHTETASLLALFQDSALASEGVHLQSTSASSGTRSVVTNCKTAARVDPKSGFAAVRNNYWTIIADVLSDGIVTLISE
jgi:hypothetical protein